MSYSLEFVEPALKEWRKLDGSLREQFKKKLRERLENPFIAYAQLSGLPECYKIKLRRSGYRLVYKVLEREVVILVVAVGRREGLAVYQAAVKRL